MQIFDAIFGDNQLKSPKIFDIESLGDYLIEIVVPLIDSLQVESDKQL